MNTYIVDFNLDEPYKEVKAAYFVEEKGWLVFYNQHHKRVAAFNGSYVLGAMREEDF